MSDRLFIIDGHALVFKMYYAFLRRPMINSKGVDTSILFGFTKYLLELIERQHPTHLVVAFDPPGGTFRNTMYPEYKANRTETPQLVIDALEPLTQICKSLNIPVLLVPGYEADDTIGSLAWQCDDKARSEGRPLDVFMVTPDKDYGQLIREHVWQYKPGKAGGEDEIYGIKEVCERYSISNPLQVIEMLALCGDTADNVPGVKGVGEVGAAKLISKYATVDNIYSHLDELSPKQREMFEQARGHMALTHDLVTIRTDVPVDLTEEQMRLDTNYTSATADLFVKYEFNSLRKYLRDVKPAAAELDTAQEALSREAQYVPLESFMAAARASGAVAVTGSGPMTLAAARGDTVVCCSGPATDFAPMLADASVAKFGGDLKGLYRSLASQSFSLAGKLMDISLMHYLCDPEKSHQIDVLAASYLGMTLEPTPDHEASLFGDDDAAPQDPSREALIVLLLGQRLQKEMSDKGVTKLYDTIEEPLISVLARMEMTGVKVDVDSLKEFADTLRKEMHAQEALVREIAGEPDLNVGSPKQVGEVIFEKLKLDPKAKKGRQWSTDEETLLALADRSPIINAILEYRATKKLLSTYIEPFPTYISPRTGRVHTTFNQALTSTGRLSSSNPNLQNIPVRTERGKEIRKAFVAAKPDWVIMSADYSQIELRIMAHLCGDEHLTEAFRNDVDVHAATASKIYGVPLEEVTSDMRRVAKTANFGIMYGISAFGLSQRLHCSRSEAKQIIDDYFASFPSIRSFIDSTLEAARRDGYVTTIFGRRRYIPDIKAGNASLRSVAERNAVNAPIQGSSADIIKLAMIGVDRRIREAGLQSMMVLQIHDELLFEVPREEIETMTKIVTEEMEGVVKLSIPLTVECNYGTNWLEAH